MSEVLFAWPIGDRHGWGIRGLGYALNWPGTAVSVYPDPAAELPPGDPREATLRRRIEQSIAVQERIIGTNVGGTIEFPDAPVFVALGNDLAAGPVAYGRFIKGRPTIACPVFEDVEKVAANISRLHQYDRVIVASRWNQEVLQVFGFEAALCHEGIDPVIFNPQVKRREPDGRFRVFSGGKAEFRKGQDIVIEAFKLFAEKHDDAVLVAAWGSPFSWSAQDFEGRWEYGAPPGIHIGQPNFAAWAQRAGIKPHQIEIVPVLPNWRMAEIYASCDVAVFPNRREGGTNFVAMECMACGVPTIIRRSFGHSDITDFACVWYADGDLPLSRNMEINQLADFLEQAMSWGATRPLSEYWTWERHCREMAEVVDG